MGFFQIYEKDDDGLNVKYKRSNFIFGQQIEHQKNLGTKIVFSFIVGYILHEYLHAA